MRRRVVVKDKKKAARRIALLIGIPVVAAGIAVCVLLVNRYKAQLCTSSELPVFDPSTAVYNGTGLFYLGDSSLSYRDFSDRGNDYTLSVQGEGATLQASSELAVLYNASGVQIIGLDYPIEFSGSLVTVRCGADCVAGLRQDSESSVSLQVFNKAEQIDQITFSGEYLVDYGFTAPSESIMWTLTEDVSASTPVSTITTYDMDRRATTGVMTQSGQLIEELCFTGSSVFAVGTNHLVRYNSVGNTQAYRVLVYGYKLTDFSSGGDSPAFLFVPRGEETLSTVKLYTLSEGDTADEKVAVVKLPSGVLSAFLSNGRLIAFSADTMYVYNSSGALSASMELDFVADSYKKLSDTYVIATNALGNYLITIR